MVIKIELSSERLCLRPLSDIDTQALFAVFSDPRVMRYGSTPEWDSLAKAEDKVLRNRRGVQSGESMCLAIFHRHDYRFLGTVDLFQIDVQCRRAELGYTLAFEAWGQGYMAEALTTLLDHVFAELAFNRIEADIDPRNAASIACLERLGFQREGLLRQRWIIGDEVSDSAIYGLLREDWIAR
ncbi:MAG: GNAT family N-acetyltransferase [Paucibacter sp.]|nr:GNAT family N-acetyltransferase [Roseateles sp.]